MENYRCVYTIILMLYWLFAGTKIEEESDGIYTPEAIEQAVP